MVQYPPAGGCKDRRWPLEPKSCLDMEQCQTWTINSYKIYFMYVIVILFEIMFKNKKKSVCIDVDVT